jgi:hypothetical protein
LGVTTHEITDDIYLALMCMHVMDSDSEDAAELDEEVYCSLLRKEAANTVRKTRNDLSEIQLTNLKYSGQIFLNW